MEQYGGNMETVRIFIPSPDAANDFVDKTSSLPFDMNLGRGNRIVDAKSLLGVLFIGVGKICNLAAPGEKLKQVQDKLGDYLVKD